MPILNDKQLEYNSRIKINFAGGDLSSDTGLLLIKKFINKIGFEKIVKKTFQTNDSATFRFHTDDENLLQKIYQTFVLV
jgi:hypothetical protein